MLDKVNKIIEALNKNDVQYVVIGGYAIILHGFLRATEDVDIVIKMSDENVLKLQTALQSVYDDPDIDSINFEELTSYPVIRYGTPDDFYIDIISNLGESFNFDKIEKISKVIDGITICFASAASLFEMKKNTYREKDKLDILFLESKLKK